MSTSEAAMRCTQVNMFENTFGISAVPMGPVYKTLPKLEVIRGLTYKEKLMMNIKTFYC